MKRKNERRKRWEPKKKRPVVKRGELEELTADVYICITGKEIENVLTWRVGVEPQKH